MPLTLSAAMLLDAVLGEPNWLWSRLPHPAVVMGRSVSALDRRLNRGRHRRAKGALALALLVLAAGALGYGLSFGGPIVEAVAAAILLAQRSLVQHVSAVGDALRISVSEGRCAVAAIVSRDVQEMDESQIARSAIESGAENLSDAVIAPAFWFLLGGLPGILMYKTVNTADSMIGYRTEQHEAFGWAAARFDDVVNLVPARLTALLIALSYGQLPWRAIAKDARRHKSPNAGWPEAAIARVLNIALAGPRSYDGQVRPLAWVNESGKVDIGPADIDASVSVMWRCWWAMLVLVLLCALV